FQFVEGTTLKTQTEGAFGFDYDPVGRNSVLTYPDGHTRIQIYDSVGRLKSRCYEYAPPAPSRCYTAEYDAVGNPTRLTDPDGETHIAYNLLDRVTSVERVVGGTTVRTETYAYNPLGALSVNNGQLVDHQRPRKGASGTASAGIPASIGSQAVGLDGV